MLLFSMYFSSSLLIVPFSIVLSSSLCHFSLSFSAIPTFAAGSIHRANSKLTMAADDQTLDQILKVAVDASKKAGEIIIGNAGGAEVTERKANSRDLLTMIDPLCERVSFVELVCQFNSRSFFFRSILVSFIDWLTIPNFYWTQRVFQTIRETVSATFPEHDFLGEEDVPPGKEASAQAIEAKLSAAGDQGFLWIVDPIGESTIA